MSPFAPFGPRLPLTRRICCIHYTRVSLVQGMTLEEHLKKHKKAAKGQKEQGGQARRPRRATPTPAEDDVGEAVAVA